MKAPRRMSKPDRTENKPLHSKDENGTSPAGSHQPPGFLKAIATVGGLTMASRVLGFTRDALQAGILGAGPVSDAFVIALTFPNLFRRLFGEGAFSTAFVPMFSGQLTEHGKEQAMAFAGRVFTLLALLLAALVLLFEAFMPEIMHLIAPGFEQGSDRALLAVDYMRITTPYLFFICLVAMLGGVLNSLDRFGAMAATPILFNLSLISALLLAGQGMGETTGHMLAWGVAISGMIQFAWMLFWCKGTRSIPRLRLPALSEDIKTLGRRLLPSLFSHGVMQISLVAGMIMASSLPAGSVSFIYYADRLTQLPLGVVGVAIATALLPRLSRAVKEASLGGDQTTAGHYQSRATEFALILTLPAAVALGVIGTPIVAVLFGRGAFEADDVAATGIALQAFSFGLPAFVAMKVLQTGFFAREDTKTPFYAGVAAMVAYLAFAGGLMMVLAPRGLGHVGLALGTALSGWVNALLLAGLQIRRGFFHFDSRLRRVSPRIIAASLLMGGALYGLDQLLSPWLMGQDPLRYPALAGLIAGGCAVYGLALIGLRATSPGEFKRMLKGRV